MNEKILIIDDDAKLQDLLKGYLAGYGFRVIQRSDGGGIMDLISKEEPGAVLLDIMLPGRDGFEVLREIRAGSSVPVIMLTAKGEETDRIVGLEMGADDYLPKPFNPRELLARIRAVMRRSVRGEGTEVPPKDDSLEAGGFLLSSGSMSLEKDGKRAVLSQTEFKILQALMKRPNTVISRDTLMNMARGRDFIAFERSIDVHISKLRNKVESLSGSKERIKTVWGSGYMFVV